jgi:hypothetical protein
MPVDIEVSATVYAGHLKYTSCHRPSDVLQIVAFAQTRGSPSGGAAISSHIVTEDCFAFSFLMLSSDPNALALIRNRVIAADELGTRMVGTLVVAASRCGGNGIYRSAVSNPVIRVTSGM